MCRSIQTLRGEPTTDEQVTAAALQYVRKISGYRAPSEANRTTFDHAVAEVARATQALLDGLVVKPAPAGAPPTRAAQARAAQQQAVARAAARRG